MSRRVNPLLVDNLPGAGQQRKGEYVGVCGVGSVRVTDRDRQGECCALIDGLVPNRVECRIVVDIVDCEGDCDAGAAVEQVLVAKRELIAIGDRIVVVQCRYEGDSRIVWTDLPGEGDRGDLNTVAVAVEQLSVGRQGGDEKADLVHILICTREVDCVECVFVERDGCCGCRCRRLVGVRQELAEEDIEFVVDIVAGQIVRLRCKCHAKIA